MAKKNSTDTTVKFLIYILLFLIFILIIVLLFIIPNIKSYKSHKSDLHAYQSQNKHLSQKQVQLSKSIEIYKHDNHTLLEAFDSDFNKTKFLMHAKKYFTNVTLQEMPSSNKKSQFKAYNFNATSLAKTPVDFYKFIDSLEGYNSIIKINFPITVISKEKSIEVDLNISIYTQKNAQ